MTGQPIEYGAEHPPLAQTAPDVPGEEQDLHGQVGVLGIGAQEAGGDIFFRGVAQGAHGGEQVEAVSAGAAVGDGAVFGICKVGFLFQFFQHRKDLL